MNEQSLSLHDIRSLKQKGYSNNQIIKQLHQQGFSSTQIFDALNQEAIQPTIPGPGAAFVAGGAMSPQSLNSPASDIPDMQEVPPSSLAPPPRSRGPRSYTPTSGPVSDEEIIETIIDEKWNDLLEDVQRIISWKERTTEQITTLDQQMKDLKEQFERLHQAVVGKVGEYDQHILQVGAEVKAMEKVFSKVLPTFTESVGELSRVADTMKKQAPRKNARK